MYFAAPCALPQLGGTRGPLGYGAALFVAGLVLTSLQPLLAIDCQYVVQNTTCVFNVSFSAPIVLVDFDYDVLITGPILLEASAGNFEVRAGGGVTINDSARVLALGVHNGVVIMGASINVVNASVDGHAQVVLQAGCPAPLGNLLEPPFAMEALQVATAGRIELRSNASLVAKGTIHVAGAGLSVVDWVSINASGPVVLGSASTCKCTDEIYIGGEDVFVQGRSLDVNCSAAYMHVADGALLTSTGKFGYVQFQNDAGSISIEGSATRIVAKQVNVFANHDVNISSDFPGTRNVWTSAPVATALNVSARGLAVLGFHGAWSLESLAVRADRVSLMAPHIFTEGSSCSNSPSAWGDICSAILNGSLIGIAAAGVEENVTFDFLIAARSSLQLERTTISAASMLFCSGGSADFPAGVILDSSGRGCGPGGGSGSGETRDPKKAQCGAGGGSHIGKGGNGAKFDDSLTVTRCTLPGAPYDGLSDMLPTAGASGGGCGADCTQLSGDKPSAGGGLIWLSATSLTLRSPVFLQANGNPGAAVPTGIPIMPVTVSGGGAGGQIFIFASSLTTVGEEASTLTASGGSIFCSRVSNTVRGTVGGAGGGGFIGLHVTHHSTPLAANRLSVTVAGGSMNEYCGKIGLQYRSLDEASAWGDQGLATSLIPCSAGYSGVFCLPCEPGRWGPGGGSSCSPCENKPSDKAQYKGSGWPNASCPYVCVRGVPDVLINKDCQNSFSFAFHFYGGTWGIVVLVSCLLLLSGFLLRRRARRKQQPLSPRRRPPTSFRNHTGPLSVGASVRQRLRLRCWESDTEESIEAGSDFHFPKKDLPYHICRVYLQGQNRPQSPWALGDELPAAIQPLVLEAQWDPFASMINAATAVSQREALVERVLRLLYPPLVPLWAQWHRRQRARKLQHLVKQVSEGAHGRSEFWKAIRARMHANLLGDLAMAFGCDSGATCGFVDFFDFSLSQLDWSHPDLRKEAWVLVAHGHGTYAEPLALDMGDPLVWHLMQSQAYISAVCSVVSTFNRISRCISADELEEGCRGPMSVRLRQKVEQCAAQCGLAEVVTVLVIQQQGRTPSARASSRRSSWRSVEDVLPLSSNAPGQIPARDVARAAVRARGSFFTDLMPSASFGPLREATGGIAPPAEQQVGGGFKLCLAFASWSALRHAAGEPPEAPPPAAAPCSVLTSPMEPGCLCEQQWRTVLALEQRSWAVFWLWLHRLSGWIGGGRCGPYCDTVLLAIVILVFLDVLAFILIIAVLMRISSAAFVCCILVPPLTQPAATFLGPIFLLSEHPQLGRLFATFSVFSLVSALVYTIVLLIGLTNWPFDFLQLLVASALKTALALLTTVHVGNIEALRDQSFLYRPQEEFVGNILSDAQDVPRGSTWSSACAQHSSIPAGTLAGAIPSVADRREEMGEQLLRPAAERPAEFSRSPTAKKPPSWRRHASPTEGPSPF